MVILFLTFGGTSILFPTMAAPPYIPTNVHWRFSFLHILTNTYLLKQVMTVVLTGLTCISLLSIFSSTRWSSVYLLWKNLYSDPLPIFLTEFFFFLGHWVVCVLYTHYSLSDTWLANIFSHWVDCLFILLMVPFIMQLVPFAFVAVFFGIRKRFFFF